MRTPTCLVLLLAGSLGACSAGGAPTATNTMSLLKSGSEKVCVAEDVEQTLREMIQPGAEDIFGSSEATQEGVEAVEIEFRLTTQEAFDPAVKRMTCATEVAIGNGADNEASTLKFTVSPDAKDAESFVVWAQVQRPRTLARNLAQSIANGVTAIEQREAQLEELRAAEERLATMVKPAWLVGWWLQEGGGYRGNCLDAGVEYRPDGTFSIGSASGTWELNGHEITRTFNEEHFNLPLPLQTTVIRANTDELGETTSDGRSFSFSRCSEDLIASLRTRTAG